MIPHSGLLSLPIAFGNNKRRAGRMRVQVKVLELGEVIDLSATGMRVVCGRKSPGTGDEISCVLESNDRTVTVAGRVAWKTRCGFFANQIGVEFVNLTEEAKRVIFDFVRAGRPDEEISKAA